MATETNGIHYKHHEEMPPKYDSPFAGYVPPQFPLPAYGKRNRAAGASAREFHEERPSPPSPSQVISPPYYQPPPQYTPASYALVSSQPRMTTTVNTNTTTSDHFLVLSIVITTLCCLSFSWLSLFCSIPAIFFAFFAQNAEARGDANGARKSRNVALFLNFAAVLVFVICIVVIASNSMRSGGHYY